MIVKTDDKINLAGGTRYKLSLHNFVEKLNNSR